MPAKPAWLLHLSEIIEQLEAFDVPVVDRGIVERVFGLRRRRAIELLHRFGGYQAGRTLPDRPAAPDRSIAMSHRRGGIPAREMPQGAAGRHNRAASTLSSWLPGKDSHTSRRRPEDGQSAHWNRIGTRAPAYRVRWNRGAAGQTLRI